LTEAFRFFEAWGVAALGASLLLVAALVNRFASAKRPRIRRALFLYVAFVVFAGAGNLLEHAAVASIASWLGPVRLVGGLLAAFTCADLLALLVFDLLLPAVGVVTLTITSDIFILFAYIFGGLGVLKAEGVTLSSVVTTSAVVSGVLALGMQATLGNIVGGVALQLDQSLHLGDWVQLSDGTQGKVVAIRWRHTVIETRNWDTVIVPNSNLLAQNITILGKRAGQPVQHRMWVYFNVDFRYAPSHVIEVVTAALAAGPIEGVAARPLPNVICYDFAKDGRDSFAYYAVRYWLTDLANDDPTNSRIRTRVHTALKRADIPLARPSRTLFVSPDEALGDRDKRHHDQHLKAIDGVELFRPLTPQEREFVASHLKHAPFTAGEVMTRQGAVAHWLYILISGRVEVLRHAEDSTMSKVVASIEAPGIFGEMGMLTGEPRRADVVARTDVDCYRLDKVGLEQILHERPEIALDLSQTLARRDVELATVLEGLDEEAQRARRAHAETRMLDRIQDFFGLERTTQI
jgi:small-conductance mechanosensitive channel/CRP-like cAMP-binding protein